MIAAWPRRAFVLLLIATLASTASAEAAIAARDAQEKQQQQLGITDDARRNDTRTDTTADNGETWTELTEWPLGQAIVQNSSNSVRSLIEAGANVTRVDGHGITYLMLAARAGHVEILRLLLQRPDVFALINATDTSRYSALSLAARFHRIPALNELLAAGAAMHTPSTTHHRMPLVSLAASLGELDTLDAVIASNRHDVDVDEEDHDGFTPLDHAAWNGHVQIVHRLLAAGAVPNGNPRRIDGRTPLLFASKKGYARVVSALLRGGASLEHRALSGGTALIIAAEAAHVEVVRVLLAALRRRGASVDSQENANNSALLSVGMSEEQRMHAAEDYNEDTWRYQRRHSPEIMRMLLQAGASLELRNLEGATALIAHAGFGHSACVKILLEAGADVRAKDDHGTDALLAATERAQRADTARGGTRGSISAATTPADGSNGDANEPELLQYLVAYDAQETLHLLQMAVWQDTWRQWRGPLLALGLLAALGLAVVCWRVPRLARMCRLTGRWSASTSRSGSGSGKGKGKAGSKSQRADKKCYAARLAHARELRRRRLARAVEGPLAEALTEELTEELAEEPGAAAAGRAMASVVEAAEAVGAVGAMEEVEREALEELVAAASEHGVPESSVAETWPESSASEVSATLPVSSQTSASSRPRVPGGYAGGGGHSDTAFAHMEQYLSPTSLSSVLRQASLRFMRSQRTCLAIWVLTPFGLHSLFGEWRYYLFAFGTLPTNTRAIGHFVALYGSHLFSAACFPVDLLADNARFITGPVSTVAAILRCFGVGLDFLRPDAAVHINPACTMAHAWLTAVLLATWGTATALAATGRYDWTAIRIVHGTEGLSLLLCVLAHNLLGPPDRYAPGDLDLNHALLRAISPLVLVGVLLTKRGRCKLADFVARRGWTRASVQLGDLREAVFAPAAGGLDRSGQGALSLDDPGSPVPQEHELCVVCWDRRKTHIMWPCAHKCVCGECAEAFTLPDASCPVCRASLDDVKRVYE